MMMKNRILLGLALCFSMSFYAQNKQWSLQEAVDYALKNNISVKQSQNAILSGEQDVIAAKGQFLPTLGFSSNYNLNIGTEQLFAGQFLDRTSNTISLGAGINQTIFNGFRTLNLYKQSKLSNEINQLELARIQDDISLNVVNAYLNILFNKENLDASKIQLGFSKKQFDQVKELVDAGVQPRANLLDSEANVFQEEQNVTVAKNNYDLSLLSMAQLLQLPVTNFDVQIIDVNQPSSSVLYDNIQPILDYAYKNRNEVKLAEKGIENAALSTEISKSGYYPSLTGSYNYSSNAFYTNLTNLENSFFTQISDNKGHGFGLRLSVPVFSQYQNSTSVAKSRIQEENAKLNLDQAKLSLEANIQRAFTDAKASYRAFEASKKALLAQELALQNAQDRYSLGAFNVFDLEQTRIRFVNAQTASINAKYDFVFKTKVLDFYLGKPITQ
jgi:outer membrane protein